MDIYAFTNNAILQRMGETIHRIRLERNLSQKQLAENAGVALSSIGKIEKGKSVTLAAFVAVLRALDSLSMLEMLLKEPELSPIAYAKMLDKQKTRQRASSSKKITNNTESEW